MLRKKKNSVEWLEFELFQQFKEIKHAIFLRHGGVSTGSYHGLNMDKKTGDNLLNVEMNQRYALDAISCDSFISVNQVHGKKIVEVPLIDKDESCDGIFTQKVEVGLLIKHADCQAAIFYDPQKRVIANVHAGWRGNVQNIYLETVEQLEKRYQCRPENLFVGVSPSLGPCCAQFIHYQTELPPSFWKYEVRPLYFDLWEIAKHQLINAGILEDHIQIAGICTCCNPQDYFSYRREKIRGGHATVIALRPQATE